MQVGHHDAQLLAYRKSDGYAKRRSVEAEIQALRVVAGQGFPDQQAVAVFGATRPGPDCPVVSLASCPDEPILLHRVDHLLEAQDVRVERRHVGQQKRQPLRPAIGQVPDVERGDVDLLHRLCVSPSAYDWGPATGSANLNVEPTPSTDSTQIAPLCRSMIWRAIARPRPVPPASLRTLDRSTL